jgi:Ca2+-binding EF-hand superfamily protein
MKLMKEKHNGNLYDAQMSDEGCNLMSQWKFYLYDCNADGHLSEEEFLCFTKDCVKMMDMPLTEADLKEKFVQCDTDKDGQISLEEFCAHMHEMKPTLMEAMKKCCADFCAAKFTGDDAEAQAKCLKFLCMGEDISKLHMGAQMMLKCLFSKCHPAMMKICNEQFGGKCDTQEDMMKCLLAFKCTDMGACAMSTWDMCLFDKNCDMCLDKEEFGTMMKCCFKAMGKEADCTQEFIDAEFKKADCDCDGNVGNCWPNRELKWYIKNMATAMGEKQ